MRRDTFVAFVRDFARARGDDVPEPELDEPLARR